MNPFNISFITFIKFEPTNGLESVRRTVAHRRTSNPDQRDIGAYYEYEQSTGTRRRSGEGSFEAA